MTAVAGHGSRRYSPTSVTSSCTSSARRSHWKAWYRSRPSCSHAHAASASTATDEPTASHRAQAGAPSSAVSTMTTPPPSAKASSPPATAVVHAPPDHAGEQVAELTGHELEGVG